MAELYLLDTNILVHSIRQDPIGQYIKATYSPLTINPRPLISIVTEGELRSLANQWDWGKQKKEQLNFLLSYFGRVPIDSSVLEAYAVIDAYSKRNGYTIGQNDIWIAATAYVTGSRLITTDKDFDPLVPTFLARDWIDPQRHQKQEQ